jgi:hypothetical protein
MPIKQLKRGTRLYHGTIWREGDLIWWGSGKYPNKQGEDGGVSFTLNKNSSSKTRNAGIIIEYSLKDDTCVIHCEHKSKFSSILRLIPEAICYTKSEEEVVIGVNYQSEYLQYECISPGSMKFKTS